MHSTQIERDAFNGEHVAVIDDDTSGWTDSVMVAVDAGDLEIKTYDEGSEGTTVFLTPGAARDLYKTIGEFMGFNAEVPGPTPKKAAPHGSQEYKGNDKHKWEAVTVGDVGHTYRLRVPGGWIYRTVSYDGPEDEGMEVITAQSTVFVPMPEVVGYAV